MKLKDKIAIVTGGSSGIGEAICYAYAKEGATVIVVNKNRPEEGVRVADQIKENGGKAEAIACDVSNEEAVKNLVQQVVKKYGRIDILVNNAGVLVIKKFEDNTTEDWNYIMDANLKGPFLLSREIVSIMKQQQYGKIIFISSISASKGRELIALYSATKGGLLGMMYCMVAELARYNINVNAISPGNTETPINQAFRENKEYVELMGKSIPTGKAFMKPHDIAEAAVFLASDGASSIHGLNLTIDEGWTSVLV